MYYGKSEKLLCMLSSPSSLIAAKHCSTAKKPWTLTELKFSQQWLHPLWPCPLLLCSTVYLHHPLASTELRFSAFPLLQQLWWVSSLASCTLASVGCWQLVTYRLPARNYTPYSFVVHSRMHNPRHMYCWNTAQGTMWCSELPLFVNLDWLVTIPVGLKLPLRYVSLWNMCTTGVCIYSVYWSSAGYPVYWVYLCGGQYPVYQSYLRVSLKLVFFVDSAIIISWASLDFKPIPANSCSPLSSGGV